MAGLSVLAISLAFFMAALMISLAFSLATSIITWVRRGYNAIIFRMKCKLTSQKNYSKEEKLQ